MFRPPHFFSAWLSKFHSPPPLEHFEHKKFLKKKDFLSFSDTEENVFSIVLKTFQARLSDTIYKSTRKFWGEKLCWKRSFLSFYLDHDRNLLCFCRTKFNRVINMHSTCQKKSVKENRKGRWKNFFRIWKKSLRRVCHIFNSHVHENSLDGKIFWNSFNFQIYSYAKRKKVRFLSKLIWPSGESCILRVHWKNMGINIWIQLFSRHWRKSNQFSL